MGLDPLLLYELVFWWTGWTESESSPSPDGLDRDGWHVKGEHDEKLFLSKGEEKIMSRQKEQVKEVCFIQAYH